MTQTALPPELVQALLAKAEKPASLRREVYLYCECGSTLDNGYCRNNQCEVDAPIPTHACEHCGHCEDPTHCVWSVRCPVCGVPPGIANLCRQGERLVGIHVERWELAGASYL